MSGGGERRENGGKAVADWKDFLTERDRAVYAISGHGARAGFGARPVILVIDVTYAFCGEKDEPIVDSAKRWRNSCGENAYRSLPVIASLLAAGRRKGIPIVYTTGTMREDGWDRAGWGRKNARANEPMKRGNIDGHAIMPEIAPEPRDIVIRKQKPSAFFATALASHLNQLKADSLIVAGTTTSGCVRATVVDAFSYDVPVTLVEDACFDRYQSSHAINLFDMQAKYADLVSSREAIAYIDGLPDGLFVLPGGSAAVAE